MISERELSAATGEMFETRFNAETMDLAGNDPGVASLSFIDDARFLDAASQNRSLAVVLVTAGLEEQARGQLSPSVAVIVVDDPRWHYYRLHNYLAEMSRISEPTVIADDAQIHPTAHIDEFGVRIGQGVVVEPNATILASSDIGPRCVIRAGAVIGTSGFEHKRTSRGVLSVIHDGDTRIGAETEVGSLTVIGRGFKRRHTIVGPESRIDCNVMVAHGSQLGARVFIAAGAVLAGSTSVGDDVWIGPSATLVDRVSIGAGSRIGIGSVVFRDVESGMNVLGNPARVTGTAS